MISQSSNRFIDILAVRIAV